MAVSTASAPEFIGESTMSKPVKSWSSLQSRGSCSLRKAREAQGDFSGLLSKSPQNLGDVLFTAEYAARQSR